SDMVPNTPAPEIQRPDTQPADAPKNMAMVVPNDPVYYQTADTQPIAAPQSKSDMVPNTPAPEIQRPDTQP
ncbi:hypothetical protein ABMD20_00605, partial [Weissella confusa]